ncbi:hypothetical protein M8J76_009066 [Diaphorina citri]|nr:hypothetical protein M8J76_009066 [Diaphorina citri]
MRQEDQDRQIPGNTETNQEARELSNLEKEFYSNLRFFEGGHPVDRPMLPKLIMKRDTMKKVQDVNEILERYLGDSEDLSHVQLGIYIGAATTLEANGQRMYHERNARRRDNRNKDAEPPWMKRIKKQIGELRAKADVIASYLTGNRSARMQRKMKNIMKQAKISETDDHLKEKLVELKDTVRQTYKAKSARLRRYTELTKRKEQNKDFTRNPKQFFKKLSQNSSESGEGQIEEEEFVTFWERIWSNKKDWNEQNTWLPKVNEGLQRVERMQDNTVSREEIATIAAKLSNWKSPGADKVQNFWVKKFTAAHGPLARVFSKALRNPESIPDWLMLGKTGIYQGDSLSPLWFCLAINPLSHLLKASESGYRLDIQDTSTKISHLLYMDDLKLFAETPAQLKHLLDITARFSKDIHMAFGLDKCGKIQIERGVQNNTDQEDFHEIKDLEPEELYKYLGVKQNSKIDHGEIKRDLTTAYKKRVTKLLNTKLSAKNLISAVNMWAVPILTYSFGVIKWSDTDLNQLDRLTRTLLNKFRCLHPNSAVERLYLPRRNGGRGLINILNLCKRQEKNMREYFIKSNSNILKSITCADQGYTPLRLGDENHQVRAEDDLEEGWKTKALHGKYPLQLRKPEIDLPNSLACRGNGVQKL